MQNFECGDTTLKCDGIVNEEPVLGPSEESYMIRSTDKKVEFSDCILYGWRCNVHAWEAREENTAVIKVRSNEGLNERFGVGMERREWMLRRKKRRI